MPILAAEPCLYPDDLLEIPADDVDGRQWQVFHTKARQEKSIARELLSFRVPFYLPLVKRASVRCGRRFSSHVPLFTGYLFVRSRREETFQGRISSRLAQILPVPDADRLEQELRQIHRLIELGAPLTPESRLVPGHRVRVCRGPLAGLEGTVLKRQGRTHLLVSVNFLQQGASVRIDDFFLESVA